MRWYIAENKKELQAKTLRGIPTVYKSGEYRC